MVLIDADELFKKEAFNNLTLEQKLSFKTLLKNIEGRSIQESMGYIMNFVAAMPKTAPLTKGERDSMLDAIVECFPESDVKKFKGILEMLQKMG